MRAVADLVEPTGASSSLTTEPGAASPVVGSGGWSWEGVGAVLLLAGSSRRPELASAGRSVLDLPLVGSEGVRTILDRLLMGMSGLEGSGVEVRVLSGHGGKGGTGEKLLPRERGLRWLKIEEDPQAFRGTGGVLLDATLGYPPETMVLVVQAAQVRREPVGVTARRLMEHAVSEGAQVVISTDESDSPDGVMLVRCGALRGLKQRGFVDFKEQALAEVSRTHRVSVVRGAPGAVAVRTLRDYVRALRLVAGGGEPDPLMELDPSNASVFRLVEEGATVGEGAVLVDSVVLRGGVVEEGALVVRSVVGEGARVRKLAAVMDRVVSVSRRFSADAEA